MENRLLAFMGKIGAGPRGAKDLAYEEACQAMQALLDGAYHPVTFGSFLLAERWKPESVEELAAFSDAMMERLVRPTCPVFIPGLVNASGAYDGKEHTLNLGVPAALVAAAAGTPVLLHGSQDIPAKRGMTPSHVLSRLGIDPLRTPDQALEDLQACRIAYLHQSIVNPAMHALLEHRQHVGKRTFLNTIEPLANPLGAETHIGGFFHRPYAETICQTIARSRLGFRRALLVMGLEGSDEIRPDRSFCAESREGAIKTYYLEPARFGLRVETDDVEAPAADRESLCALSAERILAFLEDRAPSSYRDLVLLNAAVRLYGGGKAVSMEVGLLQAKQAWESGAVRALFEAWQARCRL